MRHLRQHLPRQLQPQLQRRLPQRETDRYSHTHADSNSEVYPDCYSYSYGNDTSYSESDGYGYGHAKANTDAEATPDAEAASDAGAAPKHHAIKTVVDVLAVGGKGRLRPCPMSSRRPECLIRYRGSILSAANQFSKTTNHFKHPFNLLRHEIL